MQTNLGIHTLGDVLLATRSIAVLAIVHMRQLLDIINCPTFHSPGVKLLLAKMYLPPPFGVLHIAKRARVDRLVAEYSKKTGDKFEIAADPKLDVDMFAIYVEPLGLNLLQHGGQVRHELLHFLEAIVTELEIRSASCWVYY
jgi:hypothetical protein